MPYLAARTGAMVELAFAPELKREQLTIDMWRVLTTLHFSGPHSLIELSKVTGVKTPTLSRLIGRMADRALVSRQRSARDTRSVEVRILEAGEKTVARLWPCALAVDAHIASIFTAKELAQFREALGRLYALFDRQPHPVPDDEGPRANARKAR